MVLFPQGIIWILKQQNLQIIAYADDVLLVFKYKRKQTIKSMNQKTQDIINKFEESLIQN